MAYRYSKKSNRRAFLTTILLGVIIGLTIGYYFYATYKPQAQIITSYVYKPYNESYNYAEIGLAAVDQDGNGIVTPLIVEVKPGSGRILTNIEKLLFWVDTQQSIQIAKDVAGQVAGMDTSKYDFVYDVKSNSTLVGGPSAGAALTVATIAALENRKMNSSVMMTGTINPDGTIGEVGGVLEKAKAAKEIGVSTFLVPKGQGTETYYTPQENCVRRSGFLFCTTKYIEVTVNIGKDVGISVIEVENVSEAIKYIID
jgi:uncharacterized protein